MAPDAPAPPPRLMVVLGSTRPGRAGLPVAEWFVDRARTDATFEVDFVDLKELALPFLDEPRHPRLRRYEHQHTKDWSARVDAADAVVFVTSEYNHGIAAPLKNAIDYLHHEWAYKPAGFVSYGGVSAGTRGLENTKQVITTVKMVPVLESVNLPFVARAIEDGRLSTNDVTEKAAVDMLRELARFSEALRPLRRRH